MSHKSKFTATFLLLGLTMVSAGDQHVNLLPKLQPGQKILYVVRFKGEKRVKTESNVVVPLAPNAAQIDAHGLLNIEVLDVQQAAGKPVVRARAHFLLTVDSGVPAKKPGDEKPDADSRLASAVIEFTISSAGSFEQISGLDALSHEQQQAWREWAARFAVAWTLPARGAKIGGKWKSEQPEPDASPIAALGWARDTSYVRNDPCRTTQLSHTGELSPSPFAYDSCAVLLTTAKLMQRSSPKDSTPADFKVRELKTMGTAKGSNEMITYISLTTGLVVRATEEASQQMDVVVAKTDGSNRVHYNVDATSHSEVLLVTEVPPASP